MLILGKIDKPHQQTIINISKNKHAMVYNITKVPFVLLLNDYVFLLV
jgi:hypothetical protein